MALSVMGKDRFYGWVNLVVVAFVILVMEGLFVFSFAVFLPFICDEFGWSRGAVSGALAVTTTVGGLICPVAGIFVDKYGSRAAIVVGNIIAIIACFILAFHNRLWQFYLGSGVLVGTAIGLAGYIATTTIVNNWFIKRRSLGIAIVLSSGSLGGMFIVPVIHIVISSVGWRNTYLIMAATTFFLSTLLPGFLVRNKPEDLGQIPDGQHSSGSDESNEHSSMHKDNEPYRTPVDFEFKEAIKTPCLWYLVLAMSFQMLGIMGMMAHGVAFMIDLGITAGAASIAFGLFSGIGTVGRLGVGFLGLKYDIKVLAIGALCVMIVGMIILLNTKTFPMAILFSCILGIGSGGIMVSIFNIVSNYFGDKNYPKIMGVMTPFFVVLGGLASPIAGVIRDVTGSYITYFQAGLVLLIISTLFLFLTKPPIHPSLVGGKVSGFPKTIRTPDSQS